MDRRSFIRNAAGLFVATQLGIEVVHWRRKFFPGADFSTLPPGTYTVRILDVYGRPLASGHVGEKLPVDVTGIAYEVDYNGCRIPLTYVQAVEAAGTIEVNGLEDLLSRIAL